MEADVPRLEAQSTSRAPRAPGSQGPPEDEPVPHIPDPLARTFAAFDSTGVRWCLLRGDLDPSAGDIDVLMPRTDRTRAERIAVEHGFLPLQTWGRGSHRFLVTYDSDEDVWMTLDVVTDIRFGPYQTIRLPVDPRSLARHRRGRLFVLDDEHAFWLLLLHCLLDKLEISESHRLRLARLARRASTTDVLAEQIHRMSRDPSAAAELLGDVRRGDWRRLEARRASIRQSFTHAQPARAAVRRFANAVLRKATRLILLRRRGMTVALLAPSGAGSSSLSAALVAHLPVRVAAISMGTHRDPDASSRGERPRGRHVTPLRQWPRYLRARVLRARGVLVIIDRYTIDAASSPVRRSAMSSHALRSLIGYSISDPDVMIVLDAPPDVLFERRHEHAIDVLERRRAEYLAFAARRPGTFVIDASQHLDDVRRDVTRVLWEERRRRTARVGTLRRARSVSAFSAAQRLEDSS